MDFVHDAITRPICSGLKHGRSSPFATDNPENVQQRLKLPGIIHLWLVIRAVQTCQVASTCNLCGSLGQKASSYRTSHVIQHPELFETRSIYGEVVWKFLDKITFMSDGFPMRSCLDSVESLRGTYSMSIRIRNILFSFTIIRPSIVLHSAKESDVPSGCSCSRGCIAYLLYIHAA